MRAIPFKATVESGKLKIFAKDMFSRYLAPLEGEKLIVFVKKQKEKRSLSQNNLYWMWLQIIADETGHSKEELHDMFGWKYRMHFKEIEINGEKQEFYCIRSTTKMKTAEYKIYLDHIQRDAAEMGIVLPNPEDLQFIEP